MKVLVVDDEKEIADLVELYLKNDGFEVYKFYTGNEALQCVDVQDIDLAILDIMLPDISGLEICQTIRENYNFPIIMPVSYTHLHFVIILRLSVLVGEFLRNNGLYKRFKKCTKSSFLNVLHLW